MSLPLLNRPVGLPPRKPAPYGRKLALITVCSRLLFPGSTVESPNTSMVVQPVVL